MHWSNLVVELQELAEKLDFGDVEDGRDRMVRFTKADAEHYHQVVEAAVKMIIDDRG